MKQFMSHDIFQDFGVGNLGGPRYESERWLPKSSEDTPFSLLTFLWPKGLLCGLLQRTV